MKLVKYKGPKAEIHAPKPVNAKSKGAIRGWHKFEGDKPLEMDDAQAVLLCEIDPHNFELVIEEKRGPGRPAKSDV